ncbi:MULTISPECIES: ABC transporter permease subunit [unclassified Mesorhizobium]|uniref:ABC transporter permease subunit n=1 Tax=unclassified Mesorhizobium TaxID=325217 RepID=UPI0013DF7054|nr:MULTISPECIES: ABC transporter permease subunit [unclassified Mesorhizobium]
MSRASVISRIILPQAALRILPSYGSMLAIIIKDSAVASVIAVPEYLYRSATISAQTYRPIELFTVAIVVYLLIIFPHTRGVDLIYQRVAKLGRS